MEEDKIVIDCYDENGNVYKYKVLDIIKYQEKEYVVALKDEANNTGVEILETKHSEDKSASLYTPVEDAYIRNQIYMLFKVDYRESDDDSLNFEDDDDSSNLID